MCFFEFKRLINQTFKVDIQKIHYKVLPKNDFHIVIPNLFRNLTRLIFYYNENLKQVQVDGKTKKPQIRGFF